MRGDCHDIPSTPVNLVGVFKYAKLQWSLEVVVIALMSIVPSYDSPPPWMIGKGVTEGGVMGRSDRER